MKRPMTYDLIVTDLDELVKFMTRVEEIDPKRSLIKIRKIALITEENSENFHERGVVQKFQSLIKKA